MSALYELRENPKRKSDEETTLFHPRIVSNGTISTRKLLEEVASSTTFTVGDLEGAVTALTEKISDYLIDGYHVELGKIGYFSVSLKAKHPITDKKKVRATSIYFDNINFRASSWFRKYTRGKVERSELLGFRSSAKLSQETKQKRLEKYLDENGFITRKIYTQLTGQLKNKALDDLKEFTEQGVIECRGQGNHLIFVRNEKQNGLLQE